MGRNLKQLLRGVIVALSDEHVRGILALTFALIAIASLFYRFVEGWSLLDAVYFSVMTIATVGYGDLAPQTDLGKIFTIGYIFIGLGLFVSAATSIANGIIRSNRDDK